MEVVSELRSQIEEYLHLHQASSPLPRLGTAVARRVYNFVGLAQTSYFLLGREFTRIEKPSSPWHTATSMSTNAIRTVVLVTGCSAGGLGFHLHENLCTLLAGI
jgi:hypothetical protein